MAPGGARRSRFAVLSTAGAYRKLRIEKVDDAAATLESQFNLLE
jgi:hypothetical protein